MPEELNKAVARMAINMLSMRAVELEQQAAGCRLIVNQLCADVGLPAKFAKANTAELIDLAVGVEAGNIAAVQLHRELQQPRTLIVAFREGDGLSATLMSASCPMFVNSFADIAHYLAHNEVPVKTLPEEAQYTEYVVELGMLMREIGKSGHAYQVAQKLTIAVQEDADAQPPKIVGA